MTSITNVAPQRTLERPPTSRKAGPLGIEESKPADSCQSRVRGDIRQRVKELFGEIAAHHGIEIDAMEVAEDHVHLFVSFPPRYSISKVVGLLKSISASVLFREFPGIGDQLWGGEFWEDGYFARTVGDEVTTEMITRYIRFHEERKKQPEQLQLI